MSADSSDLVSHFFTHPELRPAMLEKLQHQGRNIAELLRVHIEQRLLLEEWKQHPIHPFEQIFLGELTLSVQPEVEGFWWMVSHGHEDDAGYAATRAGARRTAAKTAAGLVVNSLAPLLVE